MTPVQPRRQQPRLWRAVILTAAAGMAIGGPLVGAGSAQASSHREAPLIAADPKVDNTDVYAFVSPDQPKTVTLIANWIPFEEPNGGPNFYPFQDGAHYDLNIDNDGDAKADITYRWTFSSTDSRGTGSFLYNNGPVTSLDDVNLLFRQSYTLTRIEGKTSTVITTGPVAPSDVGTASMPDYASLRNAAITTLPDGGKSFAGQADDPFFADLRVFDLLYGGNLAETGNDTLKGYNVNSVALQVPTSDLSLNGDPVRNPVIGIWSSTSMQSMNLGAGKAVSHGQYEQVSRLGNPLVNEVVVPAGLKDAFNSLTPDKDATIPAVVNAVTHPELPTLIQSVYGIPAPATPRNDLVEIYLTGIAKNAPTLDGTAPPIQADLNSQILNKDVKASKFKPAEMLRLNTSIPPAVNPNRLGVLAGDLQGFPNGRRLTDDVVDISLQAVEGAAATGELVPALASGDGVNVNDDAFGAAFPYLALPNTVAVNAGTYQNEPPAAGGLLPVAKPPVGRNWLPQWAFAPLGVAGVGAVLLGAGLLVSRRRAGQSGGVTVTVQ